MITSRMRELQLRKTVTDLLSPYIDEKKINDLLKTLRDSANNILKNHDNLDEKLRIIEASRDYVMGTLVADYLPEIKKNKKLELYKYVSNLICPYDIPPDEAERIANLAAEKMVSHIIHQNEYVWLDVVHELLPFMQKPSCNDFLKLQNDIHCTMETHRESIHDNYILIYKKIMFDFLHLSHIKQKNTAKETVAHDEKTIKQIRLNERACQTYLGINLKPISEAWAESRNGSLKSIEHACKTKNHEFILSMLEFYEDCEESIGPRITKRLDTLISDWVADKPEKEVNKIDFDAIRAKVLVSYFKPLPLSISEGMSEQAYSLVKKELEEQKKTPLEVVSSSPSPTFLGRRPLQKKEDDVTPSDHPVAKHRF